MLAFTAPVCPLTVLAWRLGALSLTELWWRYADMGGNHPQPSLGAYLAGTADWPPTEHNVLAHTLNERLWEAGFPSLAPSRERQDVGA
jgi:hypothetical protein